MRAISLLISLSVVVSASSFIASDNNAAAALKPRYKGHLHHGVTVGDELLLKGKFSEAADTYHQAINENPKNLPAVVGYGTALAEQFKLDAAEEQFRKALTLDPNSAAAHVGLAKVLTYKLQSSSMTVQRNRESALKAAESEIAEALRLDSTYPDAHYQLGIVLREQGRLDESANAFREAVRNEPGHAAALAGLGMTQLAQGDMIGAQESFKRSITVNTGNSTAHYGLAKSLLAQGQTDAAIKELNTAIYQNRNSWPAHLTLGQAYETQGNFVAAIKQYHDSIRIKPENADAYLRIAGIREMRGDIEHSLSELRSGLELMPNNVQLHEKTAEQLLRLEKIDDAIKQYNSLLALSPGNAAATKGLTRGYYLKAQKQTAGAFLADNDFEQAESMLQKAIQMNPNDLELRLADAKIRALSGKQVDLKSLGAPRNNGERIAYSEALLAQDKFSEAASQMKTVIDAAKTGKEVFAVGDMALMIRDLGSAELAYNKGKTMAGGNERATRGLAQVAKARENARQEYTLGRDLVMRKQLASAVDKYHSSIFMNPTYANSRIGLAQALERMPKPTPAQLREAAGQYRAYLQLAVAVPEKERVKIAKRADNLDVRAHKVEQKNLIARQ
jgi:tetratricopeptide (TPR) repeat protein